jgi:hypothetical protein
LFAIAWSILTTAWIIEAAILSPGGIGVGLLQFLGVSLFAQLLIFSATVWLLRYRSMQAWLAGFVLASAVLGGLSAYLGLNRNVLADPMTAAAIAIGIVVVSGVIIWDAYRRWLTTELG